MNTDRYPFEQLTSRIIECAFAVHNTLGKGFLEKVYENALAIELGKHGLKVQQQTPLQVRYQSHIVGEYVADMVVDDKSYWKLKPYTISSLPTKCSWSTISGLPASDWGC